MILYRLSISLGHAVPYFPVSFCNSYYLWATAFFQSIFSSVVRFPFGNLTLQMSRGVQKIGLGNLPFSKGLEAPVCSLHSVHCLPSSTRGSHNTAGYFFCIMNRLSRRRCSLPETSQLCTCSSLVLAFSPWLLSFCPVFISIKLITKQNQS